MKQNKTTILVFVMAMITYQCSNDASNSSSNPSQNDENDECEVLSVYDGDTLTLQCPKNPEKTKVRMYCIDTPEMKQEPWGKRARDHLRSIVGKNVRVVEINKDRYGRTVGEVYAGQVNLNVAQVEAGQAAVYDAYCKKPKEYKAAEERAKSAKKGIWASSGLQQTPWDWRKQKKQQE